MRGLLRELACQAKVRCAQSTALCNVPLGELTCPGHRKRTWCVADLCAGAPQVPIELAMPT